MISVTEGRMCKYKIRRPHKIGSPSQRYRRQKLKLMWKILAEEM